VSQPSRPAWTGFIRSETLVAPEEKARPDLIDGRDEQHRLVRRPRPLRLARHTAAQDAEQHREGVGISLERTQGVRHAGEHALARLAQRLRQADRALVGMVHHQHDPPRLPPHRRLLERIQRQREKRDVERRGPALGADAREKPPLPGEGRVARDRAEEGGEGGGGERDHELSSRILSPATVLR
jgi:hypothetical protein